MGVYNDNPTATGGYVWIKADDTAGRRSRAGQIYHARIAYQKEHNVQLTLITKSYSETYGFLCQSAFRYKITKNENAPHVMEYIGGELSAPGEQWTYRWAPGDAVIIIGRPAGTEFRWDQEISITGTLLEFIDPTYATYADFKQVINNWIEDQKGCE